MAMNKTALLTICMLASYSLFAQDELPEAEYYHLKGKIGPGEAVMDLARKDTAFSGMYYWVDSASPGYLSGSMDNDGYISLTAWNAAETGGSFSLSFEQGRLRGVWNDTAYFAEQAVNLAPDYRSSVQAKLYAFERETEQDRGQNTPGCFFTMQFLELESSRHPDRALDKANAIIEGCFFEIPVPMQDPYIKMNALAQSKWEMLRESSEGMHEGWSSLPHYFDRQMDIIYNAHHFLVIEEYNYLYGGGVHGIAWAEHLNFDMQTGDTLGLGEVFIPDSMAAVSLLIKKALVPGYIEGASLEAYGFLVEDLRPGDFYIYEGGLVFYFPVYSISFYAAGEFEAFVPYSELSSCMLVSSPLRRLFE